MTTLNKITLLSLVLVLLSNKGRSQSIKNFGDVQIHNSAELGVYSSFINDGILSGKSGLMGFYGDNSLVLSGSQIPIVFDAEIANEMGLFLDIPIEVTNNMNFIFGDIITDKEKAIDYLDLSFNATFQGESDFSKTDGFVRVTLSNENYLFPTGDETFLRPLAVKNANANNTLKCAYFFENPGTSISNRFGPNITAINQHEFWKLTGAESLEITIGWNERSSISTLAPDLSKLTIVGYHTESEQWVDLGAVALTGNVSMGFITSGQLIPNDYEAFTFGANNDSVNNTFPTEKLRFLVSANGDGKNDYLYIPELENYESNQLQIFNRYGVKVFESENYVNEFDGTYTLNSPTLSRNDGLPTGVYFFIVNIPNEEIKLQGFLYLSR